MLSLVITVKMEIETKQKSVKEPQTAKYKQKGEK